MNIALIILNWNGKKLLEKFLPSVVANSKEAKLYVVDNASTDDSILFLNKNYPNIKILKNTTNKGYSTGYNTALQHIKADVFCLLNSDVEVTKNWLQPILNFYKNTPNASIVQPKILDYKNKTLFEYAGAAGGFLDKYGYAFCRGRVFDTLEKDTNQYQTNSITWASGACFFIKNTDFKLLEGFDEDFFAHYEEIDLCWRAKNKNLSVHFIAESTVYHVGGATLNNSNPFKTYLNFRNSLYTLAKNLPSKKLIPIIFIRMVLDGIAGVRFLCKGQRKHLWSILKAHGHFYLNLPKMIRKRDTQQNNDYYHQQSIVWSYFIKQQKQFKS